MAYRKRMSRKANRKNFKRGQKTNRKNLSTQYRGGVRL